MNTIELFCGTKSFSKIADKLGHNTYTIDIDPQFNADETIDIKDFRTSPYDYFSIIWASPPCQGFSVASIGKNWTGGKNAYIPKSDTAKLGITLVKETMRIIDETKPKYWFIENPRGILRKMEWFNNWIEKNNGIRNTVTYCQYGDTRMKPTDIWTNCKKWKPKKMCKNGDPCHEAAPRGWKTGTQGLKDAKTRGIIPKELFEEIFNSI